MNTYTIIGFTGCALLFISFAGLAFTHIRETKTEAKNHAPPVWISTPPNLHAVKLNLSPASIAQISDATFVSMTSKGHLMIQPPDGPKIELMIAYFKNFAPNATVLLENGRIVVDDGIKSVAFDFPEDRP